MKIALFLRGFHFLARDRFGFPLDARKYLRSLSENVIDPLRAGHEVKIFIASYPSPVQADIVAAIKPDETLFADPASSTQASTFAAGLGQIEKSGFDYDKIICTRFDLKYLKPVQKWDIWRDDKGIYFPWKEYEAYWRAEQRVGDAIHVLDRGYVEMFARAALQLQSERDLHGLCKILSAATPDVFFIEDGFYDSNTLYFNRECRNPLYRIANRPRLPLLQPRRPVGNLPFGEGIRWRRKLEMKFERAVIKFASAYARIFARARSF